ncbi:MAG: hypothetical protein V3V26_00390 [Candidatus Aenigmarchaeota archaeon]
MVLAISRKRDKVGTVRLLRVLKDSRIFLEGKNHIIANTPDLREASDSFCVSCGRCCPVRCTAREYNIMDNKVYCKLHDGRGEPAEYPVRTPDPDPDRMSKPDNCMKAGPGTFYLSMERLDDVGEPTTPCYQEIKKAMVKYRKHLADLA